MQIVVHVGFPKTGSSSIQHYLAAHRDGLLQDGVRYPEIDDDNHHGMLAVGRLDNFEKRRRFDRRQDTTAPLNVVEEAWRKLHECLDSAKASDLIVLSSEVFSAPYAADERYNLPTILDKYASSVRILAYGRKPESLYPSSLQQRLKSPGLLLPDPSQWISSHGPRHKAIVDKFGAERCDVRIHSPKTLVGGDVVEDFVSYIEGVSGRKLPRPESKIISNRGLSAPACAILVALRKGEKYDMYKRIRKTLKQYDQTSSAPRLELPEEWSTCIASNNSGDWNALVESTSYDRQTKDALLSPAPADSMPKLAASDPESWCLSKGSSGYTREFSSYFTSVYDQPKRRFQMAASELNKLAEEFQKQH